MDQELPNVLPSIHVEPSEEQSLPSNMEQEEPLLHPLHAEEEREGQKSVLPHEFLEEMARLATPEEKLDRIVLFMQEIIEGGGLHQFKEFWEARRLCLELFQTPIHPIVRVRLWARYSELCREARRLKEAFEEQSSFVTEQVEKAIDAIEEDFAGLDSKLSSMPDIEGLKGCRSIVNNIDQYQALQHELFYLNSFASRITSLRKEVLKTEIRYKQKSRLLERLRVFGDWVYPRRKQAIQRVSELFLADVDGFIQSTFVGELKMHELFEAREEIKILQGVGKLLTISTEAFTKTRLQLSQCWDSIKTVLKEKKKAQAEQRQTFRHHRDEIIAELDKLKAGLEGGAMKVEDVRKELHQIDSRMHSLSLGHQDVRITREKFREIDALVAQKGEPLEKGAPQGERKERKSKAREVFTRAEEILKQSLPVKEADEAFHALLRESLGETLSKSERLDFDRLASKIRGKIEGLRKERLPSLSGEEEIAEELVALDQMHSDIKRQLEVWRRASGGSGYDFSEGLRYQELAEDEKARLDRIDAMIEELEERLSNFQEDTPEATES